MILRLLCLTSCVIAAPLWGQGRAPDRLAAEIDRRTAAVESLVVAWRRDIHQHPELGNRETRTAQLVADHLRRLGLEVRTGVAHTGVVGVLGGGKPGRVVALRADMDALPVTEQVDLPFKSTVRTIYNGQDVGVMHACGHDNHTAMLMGVAQVLAGVQAELPGTVVFLFQPAEEGAPAGEEGGAALMLKEGVFDSPRPEAIFALHVFPDTVGHIKYRSGPALAASDPLRIVVRGRQTHGAQPWKGVDPITVAAQIVLGLQTIPSRQTDVTVGPAVVTIGRIDGGVRNNIIPDSVVLLGTVRTFDASMQDDIHTRIRRTATLIAQSAGATAEVTIQKSYPVTVNDPALVERMVPTLARVAGAGALGTGRLRTGAEDFSFFAQRVPGFYFYLGVTPPGQDLDTVAVNHSPLFYADERALPVGVRALAHLAVDYLRGGR
ncbi:MAG: amidohydrolase [Gemmatimonadales bacterium]